jgi:hypothetical protein
MINTRWALQWEELYRRIAQLNNDRVVVMWDVIAVSQCGECEKLNSEPYDEEQISYLLESLDFEHQPILLIATANRPSPRRENCRGEVQSTDSAKPVKSGIEQMKSRTNLDIGPHGCVLRGGWHIERSPSDQGNNANHITLQPGQVLRKLADGTTRLQSVFEVANDPATAGEKEFAIFECLRRSARARCQPHESST